jgi:hypothetical protein
MPLVVPHYIQGNEACVEPQSLKAGRCVFSLGGVMVALKYVIVGVVVVVVVVAALVLLPTLHQAPVQYVGSQNGYEAFVPNGQTINYNGHTDPVGDLILNNGNTIHDVIWDGQYANTIIQNHNQIGQLNNQLNGDMQDFYVIKGPVPAEQVTIDGQTYIVIEADKINPADIAGFYTYQGWVRDFVAAMNTPGTYAAVLPGNSPVFTWDNATGRVADKVLQYKVYGGYPSGRDVLVPTTGPIIPYGVTSSPLGSALSNFTIPQQSYNPSS